MFPTLPGWHLLGSYPEGEPDGVGAWLLHHGGEALLLEVPPSFPVSDLMCGLAHIGCALRYVSASHEHMDHFDIDTWIDLGIKFNRQVVEFINPAMFRRDRCIMLGGEPLYLLRAPKHSATDIVTVFRGVAHLGDIELGTLDSVNNEVSDSVKRRSMRHLRQFSWQQGYDIHTTVSAHLNDIRTGVDWFELFAVGDG